MNSYLYFLFVFIISGNRGRSERATKLFKNYCKRVDELGKTTFLATVRTRRRPSLRRSIGLSTVG